MYMSELQAKDVINTKDGKKIGKITDIVVNQEGVIDHLIIEPKRFFKRFINLSPEVKITFNQIIKFGTDVILVDLTL